MHETRKCRNLRKARGDFDKYLRGSGLDIGAGPDPLEVPHGTVRAWDVADGDGQMLASLPDDEFDFVYSSHCLEHLRDVDVALRNWLRVVKPGGFVYVVVPDYVLYEKMTWPSRFNRDHKQSFSALIPRRCVVRPNHFHIEQDLIPLFDQLGADVLHWQIEDAGFNYNFALIDQTLGDALAQICIIAQKRPQPAASHSTTARDRGARTAPRRNAQWSSR